MTPNKKLEEKTIIGIDPGTNRIGYGIIKTVGKKISYQTSGLIEIKEKYAPDQLRTIHERILSVIDEHHPDVAVIEKLFFSNNKKTAMAVSEARGAILLTLSIKGIAIKEVSPNEAKQAVTGYGQADKKAVLKMVQLILGLKNFKPIDDTSDALAIAIAGSLTAS